MSSETQKNDTSYQELLMAAIRISNREYEKRCGNTTDEEVNYGNTLSDEEREELFIEVVRSQ